MSKIINVIIFKKFSTATYSKSSFCFVSRHSPQYQLLCVTLRSLVLFRYVTMNYYYLSFHVQHFLGSLLLSRIFDSLSHAIDQYRSLILQKADDPMSALPFYVRFILFI